MKLSTWIGRVDSHLGTGELNNYLTNIGSSVLVDMYELDMSPKEAAEQVSDWSSSNTDSDEFVTVRSTAR